MSPRQYKRKNAPATALATMADVKSIVPTASFTELSWWGKLNQEEQSVVLSEGQQLASALLQFGYSRMAIGEHLSRLQGVLEPHNLFTRFLKNFHFSKRTAYRYIAGFQNAKQRLPETVLKAAMARGVNIIGDSEIKPLGVYTDAVAKLPPPSNASEVQANTWLDQIEQVRKDTRASGETMNVLAVPVPQDPQTLLKECYRFISMRYKRLPNNSKTKANFVRSLIGMILAELGVSGQQTFAPVAIPEEFRVGRGRPRTSQIAASA